jgi:hypothetical protein
MQQGHQLAGPNTVQVAVAVQVVLVRMEVAPMAVQVVLVLIISYLLALHKLMPF